jgi:AAA ATPase domain
MARIVRRWPAAGQRSAALLHGQEVGAFVDGRGRPRLFEHVCVVAPARSTPRRLSPCNGLGELVAALAVTCRGRESGALVWPELTMKIKGFQVLNYRCVMDSGWVEIDQLTVLVGKNESGKTSLLRALHKFRPFNSDPYVIDREWPRGRRHTRNPDAVVTRVGFELEDEELAQLYPVLDDPATQSGPFAVSRTYSGKYTVELSDELFPSRPPKTEIFELMKSIVELAPPSNTAISSEFLRQSIDRISALAFDGEFGSVETAGNDIQNVLLANVSEPIAEDTAFVTNLGARVKEIAKRLREAHTTGALVAKFVLDRLPTFIYMDDYRTFHGSALLDQVRERKVQGKLTDQNETLITIMELSGLELDSEFAKGQSDDQTIKEQRQYDLNDAGNSLTDQIAKRWNQRRYEV